jgi:hypothetical protein
LLRDRRSFQTWRQRWKRGDRVPPALWALAVLLARIHGFSRTAVALGVNYYRLKKRSEGDLAEATPSEPPATGATFVELPAAAVFGEQCLFELNSSAGATLCVQLHGSSGPKTLSTAN